jgi:hypothetical protein
MFHVILLHGPLQEQARGAGYVGRQARGAFVEKAVVVGGHELLYQDGEGPGDGSGRDGGRMTKCVG